jgi:hypothetical protein
LLKLSRDAQVRCFVRKKIVAACAESALISGLTYQVSCQVNSGQEKPFHVELCRFWWACVSNMAGAVSELSGSPGAVRSLMVLILRIFCGLLAFEPGRRNHHHGQFVAPVGQWRWLKLFQRNFWVLRKRRSGKTCWFWRFYLREKPERPSRNPKTRIEIPVSARRVVIFHPCNSLIDDVDMSPYLILEAEAKAP